MVLKNLKLNIFCSRGCEGIGYVCVCVCVHVCVCVCEEIGYICLCMCGGEEEVEVEGVDILLEKERKSMLRSVYLRSIY